MVFLIIFSSENRPSPLPLLTASLFLILQYSHFLNETVCFRIKCFKFHFENFESDQFPFRLSSKEETFKNIICDNLFYFLFQLADEYWDDPTAHGKKTGAKEITTHVSIHSIHPDGLIELHRQFLRLPDGAIIEVGLPHTIGCFSKKTRVKKTPA